MIITINYNTFEQLLNSTLNNSLLRFGAEVILNPLAKLFPFRLGLPSDTVYYQPSNISMHFLHFFYPLGDLWLNTRLILLLVLQ